MRLMIRRIEVYSIPARRERNLRPNPTSTEMVGQMRCVVASARRSSERFKIRAFEAAMADAAGFAGGVAEHWVTGEHPEALLSRLVEARRGEGRRQEAKG
jgi:hypothetical protein